jgi:uncharacterized protein (TIGR02118 family)
MHHPGGQANLARTSQYGDRHGRHERYRPGARGASGLLRPQQHRRARPGGIARGARHLQFPPPNKAYIMIKVSILYPNTAGSTFDMDYYRNKHMPMVKEKMAGACSHFTIDQGLAGATPGAPATYSAIGNLFFESVERFQQAFAPHGKAIAADIPNYTNVAPVIQISQVLVA